MKHSRQKTGRPCVGLKGTVVSLPHWEQVVRVSVLLGTCPGTGEPRTETRFALQALQRLGSFLNYLSKKKSCSPAVKTKSAPQSIHLRILSWNSIPHPIPQSHPLAWEDTRLPMRASTRRVVSTPPRSLLPRFGPPACLAGLQRLNRNARGGPWEKSGASERETVGEKAMGQPPRGQRPMGLSVLYFASLLAASVACQSFP